MSDANTSLNGQLIAPGNGAVPEWIEAQAIVERLHQQLPGPASAQLALCMAMFMIDREEAGREHTDDEFIGQITRSLRLLCSTAEGSA